MVTNRRSRRLGSSSRSRKPIERTTAGRTALGVIGRRVIAAKLAESCFDPANLVKIRAFTRKSHNAETVCAGWSDLALARFWAHAFDGTLPPL
jgi:ornithine cyclodeaminase/alanine dehydrogenase-like protein (mu-crystallin family)